MEFKKISIKNFRNFDNIEIDISNKNIFFGLNDIGKTNFLYAMRYVFDKDVRKNGFLDSDFHRKNTAFPIEIIVSIDISEINDQDNQKLRAQMKGAVLSDHSEVFIKLVAEYNVQELIAMPIMYWGSSLDHLQEIKQQGYRYAIDHVFNVIYIDSYVDLYSLFKKNIRFLMKRDNPDDNDILEQIQSIVDQLNENISNLSGVKEFEEKITPQYQKFRSEKVSISIKSEIAVKGLYSNIVPYIKQDTDDNCILLPEKVEKNYWYIPFSIYSRRSMENGKSIYSLSKNRKIICINRCK